MLRGMNKQKYVSLNIEGKAIGEGWWYTATLDLEIYKETEQVDSATSDRMERFGGERDAGKCR